MSGGNASLPILGTVIFLMLMLYVMIGSYMEHKHSPFGHETGVALVAGLIISAIIHYSVSDLSLTFNGEIFFYVCLPPIIFAAGFNMRRRRFFENIGYILTFGIFGTIITFFVFAGLTSLISNLRLIKNNNLGDEVIELELIESFLLASLLCSSDVIAAISIVKYEEQPKLFSIIFGEGIVNDAVALILFKTVSDLKDSIDNN
jgi:sodium/hydrogen exchanger-like protein 6/7/sodium/hydrogen exchanger 8